LVERQRKGSFYEVTQTWEGSPSDAPISYR